MDRERSVRWSFRCGHGGGKSRLERDVTRDEGMDEDLFFYSDSDSDSELPILDDPIDFDLFRCLHSFVATVDGQANVVKDDSLILIDDSINYWWLVKVLRTQEVGYIPAENIETPAERLARFNKYLNIDVRFNPSAFFLCTGPDKYA